MTIKKLQLDEKQRNLINNALIAFKMDLMERLKSEEVYDSDVEEIANDFQLCGEVFEKLKFEEK